MHHQEDSSSSVVHIRVKAKTLQKYLIFNEKVDEQFSCGGWLVSRPAHWKKAPFTAKYINNLPSKNNESLRQWQQKLIENEFYILRYIEANIINYWVL